MSAFPTWLGADGVQHRYYMKTKPVTIFDADSALGHGCVAVKTELEYVGLEMDKFDPSSPLLGTQADALIREFQSLNSLDPDGQAGPKTCKILFLKRTRFVQNLYNIPNDLTAKQIQVESAWDPSARGSVDPRDRGLVQINSGAHPEISDAEADSPAFSIDWSAQALRTAIDSLTDIDTALAAHNVGYFYAKKWRDAGKPATGVFTSAGKDIAVVCTNYVKLIKSQVI